MRIHCVSHLNDRTSDLSQWGQIKGNNRNVEKLKIKSMNNSP